ncbi:Agenet domain plant type [Arabidopsis thaliana x Arabidopsis arenosa]|uniref:Agenet domain plant type n=1 Tax=Arabidopsis thaliana x Arabidopsis arenosa TaxID=1240361 RepID=A0A8T1YCB4_9BRAS|nr:Agenet domain plant type [Arabidopsis thaliana x Arabidopsis arenosa]KAG7542520.1 Agenet domain plant type [Arabidopsis thaliana x Arabidopsis arenosa]
MDYDDNDFQNQNLHLAAEANNKFPPVLQPYALPKFDFDDTLNTHLRFDSLGESEAFLGIEGNEDNNWIEDFSRGSSGIVFSSGATESCAISRHNNVWSEATSTESVEMLLNSVGQDEVIVREDTVKKSDKSDELGCTMEPKEPGQTSHEKSPSKEETVNLQPNPSVDDTSGEFSVVKTDDGQEQVLVKDDSPNAVEEASVEEKNAILTSNTVTVEAVDTAGLDIIGPESTDDLLHQTEEKANIESRIEDDCSDRTVPTVITCSGELNNQSTLLPETSNDENVISDHIQSSYNHSDITIDAQSVLVEAHSDSHIESASEAENVEAENIGETAEPDLKEIELSDVTVLERGDQALPTVEVGGQDVSGTQCQDLLVSTVHTRGAVEASLELVGELTTIPNSVSIEKPESLSHQHMEVITSVHESTFQMETETHTQIHVVETSESVYISPMDSMVEATKGGVSKKSDSEGSAPTSNLEQRMELPVNADDRDQDVKNSPILSESVVSESVGYVSGGPASKLAEPKSQSDTIPTDKSGTMIDYSLNREELQPLNPYGAPAVSLTSSIDLHIVKTSSDTSDQGSFSKTEKISSGEPENGQTVPPVDASSSGSQMDKQARKIAEDTQQSTHFVEGCPGSEGSKDAVDADADAGATGQVLLQQSGETILEKTLVTEVVNAPDTQLVLDKDNKNEKPSTSSLANLGSEAGKDHRKEDSSAASGGIMSAGTPVSNPKGDAIVLGDSCASTVSEPSAKSHVTAKEDAATNLKTPLNSFPTVTTAELQLNKTETDSVKKPEDQNISSFMSAGSSVLNNETFSSEMNLTPDQLKAGEISKAVNFSQATLVSPIVVGSPSTSSLEKTAAKSSKTKSERKPRRTSKSVGRETSRKGTSVKGATPFQQFQSGGKTNAVNQSSACPIQITQSTEKQQSLQSPALKAFGTLSTPTASLPDLNSAVLSSILRRPFTDLQQVQLRAQIFVYGALIQGTAPDEAYMISAFGGPDGGKGSWEKAWRSCVVRAQKSFVATPETPLQSRAGKTETPSAGHTNSKESSATNPMIPLSSPLWSLSTSLDTLQSSSIQRGSTATHQPLLSSSHAHQTPPTANIVGHNTPWMSPLPFRNSWLASQQTSGFDVGSRFPVYPMTEPVKLTPMKESSLTFPGAKHVQSGTSGNVFKVTSSLEPTSTVVAPAQHSTGTKSRKRKKMPVSVESGPNILNSLKQTELAASPLVSISTAVPITPTPANLGSNAGTLPNVVSITAVPMDLVSTFPGKKIKSSLPSPIFGGNLVPEVKQRSVLSEDTMDKLKEAKMHAEDASALATAAVSHSEYVWKRIEQQSHAGLQPETQDRLASAAVAIAAAAAVAKAAAAAANVAANAALQAKLMAEEASLLNTFDQRLPKSNDNILLPGHGTPASILKGEGAVGSSSSVLIAAREASKKRVEAATAATKRAENMDSIVKAAELASDAVSQAGILVSMGHPPSLNKLVEAGPSNYWRQAQGSHEVQPCTVVLEKESVATSEGTIASPRTVQTELGGSLQKADGVSGPVSATGKKKGQKGDTGADLAINNDVVLEPEVGSKISIDTQTESQQSMKATNNEDIKEGSNVEVFKEEPGLRTAWYSANVLSLEDDKAYVLFNDLSVEQDKLKEWVALKGEGDQAPKIRTARSVTAMPYEGTRKRRRAALGDHVWKIGDRVDSWVHDSWLEGVITEKNKKDENTVTVHFPAQGDTLTIKSWNLRPSLVWKDGKWIECSSSGENISSSHEGDTPKEKRPRLGTPALVAEVKDTSMKIVDDPNLEKLPQTGVLDLGVSENTFNIGKSTREENKPDPLRMKRTGLQKQGSKVIFGVPKPGKKRKFMDVSKHYVSEASTKTQERKEPVKPVKSVVPQNSGIGSWRVPSKTITREKQTTISKPKTFKPAPKPKEKPGAAARTIPRKDLRNTTASDMESDDAADASAENKGPASGVPFKGTVEEQTTSSSHDTGSKNSSSLSTNKGKVAPTAGRLAKIEEDKALAENSSKTSEGMEPRRSIRRIQPTSRLLEGLQTSMMTSKIPSVSHSRSHQSQSKK